VSGSRLRHGSLEDIEAYIHSSLSATFLLDFFSDMNYIPDSSEPCRTVWRRCRVADLHSGSGWMISRGIAALKRFIVGETQRNALGIAV